MAALTSGTASATGSLHLAIGAELPTLLRQTLPAALQTDNGDFIMPSLSEFLGEDIDNLGFSQGSDILKADLVSFANNFIGCRYRSGGKGPKVFDCSGFTSYVFRNFGYQLNSSSSSQSTQGEAISDLRDAQPGDLMFFSGRRGGRSVGHVGMIIDVNPQSGAVRFIHASTSRGVMIDSYPDGGYYSKRFIGVRRVIND